jgi:hypothetical protein
MNAIFIVGAGHEAYQIRQRCHPHDGADAFKLHIEQILQEHACNAIAEEMSDEALKGRHTVGQEVATAQSLKHILCDPTSSEREALGISKDDTPSNRAKRENEWLRRLVNFDAACPVLFLCGATHVCSFARRCRRGGLETTIATYDFEPPKIIPIECRYI